MLAFDLHGVVMNLMPVMCKYFREVVGFELDYDNPRFDFTTPDWYDRRRLGIDIAHSIRTMAAEHARPVHGSIPALKRWRDQGNEIVFVTASAESTMKANAEWLDKWLGQPYTLVRVQSHDSKTEYLVKLGVTHYIDDRFKTCNDLADHLTHVYLFDAYCNRGRKTKANVTRVRSLRKMFNHYKP
jgi:hypothetical protein